ncbi:hypothetical protein TI05_17015, partial [Achromatium sp. WMS3]
GLQVRLFNPLQVAARQFILTWPLYRYADLRGQDRVHLVILGFTAMAEQLIMQVITQCHYKDLAAPMITVLDQDAQSRGYEFLERYPSLQNTAHNLQCPYGSLQFIDCNVLTDNLTLDNAASGTASILQRLELQVELAATATANDKSSPNLNNLTRGSVTAIAACFDDSQDNIVAAMRFSSLSVRTRLARAPIFIWLTHDMLPDLLRPVASTPNLNEILQPFGTVESTCTYQEMVEGHSDTLPRVLHEAFVAKYPQAAQAKPWTDLSEHYRDSNRSSADYMAVKLATANYYWQGRDCFHWAKGVNLSDFQGQPSLAELEHRRWLTEKLLDDWCS